MYNKYMTLTHKKHVIVTRKNPVTLRNLGNRHHEMNR